MYNNNQSLFVFIGKLITMTISKERTINIPVWLVSILLPLIIGVAGTFVTYNVKSAETEFKTNANSKQIELIQNDKIGRNEFNLIIKQLDRIEDKLDDDN